MQTFVRLFLSGFLAVVVLGLGLVALPAAAASPSPHVARNACAGSAVCEAAGAVIRAGRITVHQTTFALVRVIKHEALAHGRTPAPRGGAR